MESVLRNVKDIVGDDRRGLEHVVGAHLRDHQQVLIHVLDIDVVPADESRGAAIGRASAIAEQGRAHAAAQGVSPEEADDVIDDAIRNVRQRRQT
jgi:hypothetical protein